VKRVDDQKGYAFVFCRDLFHLYQADVWVAKENVNGMAVGQSVQFSIKIDNKGRPQAERLSPDEDAEHATALAPATLAGSASAPAAPTSAVAALDGGLDDDLSDDDDFMRITGTIKSFSTEHGYGFLTGREAMFRYGRDVFLHSKQIGDFQVGDTVTFAVRIEKGRPQGYTLRPAPKSLAWLAADDSEDGADDDASDEPEDYIGRPELHDWFGRDVFIHQSQFEGLHVGDTVKFGVQVKKGQPQACDVALAEAQPASSSQPPQSPEKQEKPEKPQPTSEELSRKLCRACSSVRADCIGGVEELLAARADPDQPDVTGQTPLMLSALSNWLSDRKCRLLIEQRADIWRSCGHSENAVQWARERINESFAAYLEGVHKGDAPELEIVLEASAAHDEF